MINLYDSSAFSKALGKACKRYGIRLNEDFDADMGIDMPDVVPKDSYEAQEEILDRLKVRLNRHKFEDNVMIYIQGMFTNPRVNGSYLSFDRSEVRNLVRNTDDHRLKRRILQNNADMRFIIISHGQNDPELIEDTQRFYFNASAFRESSHGSDDILGYTLNTLGHRIDRYILITEHALKVVDSTIEEKEEIKTIDEQIKALLKEKKTARGSRLDDIHKQLENLLNS